MRRGIRRRAAARHNSPGGARLSMSFSRRPFRQLAAGAAALASLTGAAVAQIYPSRTVTIIVPFAAGGPTDTIGRLMAERMQASLGQPFIVENVSGAGSHRRRAGRARATGRLYAHPPASART